MLAKPTLNSAEEKQAFDVDAIFSPFEGLSPEPAAQYCPQSAFEPMLLSHIRRQRQRGALRHGVVLVRAGRHGRHSGRARTWTREQRRPCAPTISWPPTACTAQSATALGVTTSGYGALPIYVVFIYFRAPWRKFVPQTRRRRRRASQQRRCRRAYFCRCATTSACSSPPTSPATGRRPNSSPRSVAERC